MMIERSSTRVKAVGACGSRPLDWVSCSHYLLISYLPVSARTLRLRQQSVRANGASAPTERPQGRGILKTRTQTRHWSSAEHFSRIKNAENEFLCVACTRRLHHTSSIRERSRRCITPTRSLCMAFSSSSLCIASIWSAFGITATPTVAKLPIFPLVSSVRSIGFTYGELRSISTVGLVHSTKKLVDIDHIGRFI